MLGQARSLALAQLGADPVREREHLPDDRAELLAAVGVDPASVEPVRRAALTQRLADLPVDPVAGKERPERFGEGVAVDDGEQAARVGKRRRRQRRCCDLLLAQAEVARICA